MTGAMSWQPPPDFSYGLPMPVPTPVPGCADCADFVARHRAARYVRDGSAAADARVLMRRHLDERHR
ncbi:hypothetical protein [Streptacidiphilus sp. PB12-B1b]|uniref:hypothetical protein n=1 Tax=Streptacidiphilus sp. PB12-B1b TaxID=2705012 RepID=UPI001CDB685D|nr:hypothetical protein [Streptacidiphilus sp. PB12-B1b]